MSVGPNSNERNQSPYEHTRFLAVDTAEPPGRRDALTETLATNAAIDSIAKAYNQAGDDYVAYADGNP